MTGQPGWWRRQGPWVLGAALLAAGAVLGPYLVRAQFPVLPKDPARAQVVAPGQWGQLSGMRWRWIELSTLDMPDVAELVTLPDNGQVLLVRLDVVPGKGGKKDWLRSCQLSLRDAAGRSWEMNPVELEPLRTLASWPFGCEYKPNPPQRGPNEARALFVVPKDVPLNSLRLEAQFGPGTTRDPDGSYLDLRMAGGR